MAVLVPLDACRIVLAAGWTCAQSLNERGALDPELYGRFVDACEDIRACLGGSWPHGVTV